MKKQAWERFGASAASSTSTWWEPGDEFTDGTKWNLFLKYWFKYTVRKQLKRSEFLQFRQIIAKI